MRPCVFAGSAGADSGLTPFRWRRVWMMGSWPMYVRRDTAESRDVIAGTDWRRDGALGKSLERSQFYKLSALLTCYRWR